MNNKFDDFSKKLTASIGSTKSLIVHTILFIGIFSLRFFGVPVSDILLILTTLVSLEAIYLSIFIQITVNRQAKELEEVSEDIEEIQKDVEEIQEDVEEVSEDIDEIQKDVEEIQENVEEVSEDIDEIQKDVEEIQEDVEEVSEDIDEIQKDVEDISEEEEAEENEEKLEAQMEAERFKHLEETLQALLLEVSKLKSNKKTPVKGNLKTKSKASKTNKRK
jgi:uncharacterized protein YoxC